MQQQNLDIFDDEDGVIGITNQILDDKHLLFIVNNNKKCNIGDFVGVKVNSIIYVLAQIQIISTEYYLDNPRQYFVSKAVENSLVRLASNSSKPRYGQQITAKIIGYYENSHSYFAEVSNTVNKYTTAIFQPVYRIREEESLGIYGLSLQKNQSKDLLHKTIHLGYFISSSFKNIPAYFPVKLFKRHTLVTGVTGAGKSRLTALLTSELASIGAHISILDPHDEYVGLLSSKKIKIFQYSTYIKELPKLDNVSSGRISFYEKYLNPHILSRLLPSLSDQQKNVIYEAYDLKNYAPLTLKQLISTLINELTKEFEIDYPKDIKILESAQAISIPLQNQYLEFVERYIRFIRSALHTDRASKSLVIIAAISKLIELGKRKILTDKIPNWLSNAPGTVDVFSVDYGTNEEIRRYIDGIFQFFLREKIDDELRILIVDEAHILINETTNNTTSQLIKQLLREARKFNISVVFISQNQSDIPSDILTQFQNNFTFRELHTSTSYYPDQMCNVTLYSAKANFVMKVLDV